MKIVQAEPPLMDEIDAALGVRALMLAGKRPIFCFGDTIYNPTGFAIGPELLAHEAVHAQRQGDDIDGWWRRYIADKEFRLAEEIPAHAAEYRAACEQVRDRNERARRLHVIALRLASPFYGNLVDHAGAKRAICALT